MVLGILRQHFRLTVPGTLASEVSHLKKVILHRCLVYSSGAGKEAEAQDADEANFGPDVDLKLPDHGYGEYSKKQVRSDVDCWDQLSILAKCAGGSDRRYSQLLNTPTFLKMSTL